MVLGDQEMTLLAGAWVESECCSWLKKKVPELFENVTSKIE